MKFNRIFFLLLGFTHITFAIGEEQFNNNQIQRQPAERNLPERDQYSEGYRAAQREHLKAVNVCLCLAAVNCIMWVGYMGHVNIKITKVRAIAKNDGYKLGKQAGYKEGYQFGKDFGHGEGYTKGHRKGYNLKCKTEQPSMSRIDPSVMQLYEKYQVQQLDNENRKKSQKSKTD